MLDPALSTRQSRGLIRPPDPAIRSTTLAYMRIGSAEACRRLCHLAFRDAHSALDLTYAGGRFWREPLPPGLAVTTNNLDPAASTDLHVDFTATGLPSASYDLVVYDPPHVADGGTRGIMAQRYGSIRTTAALRELLVAGAREAWRLSSVGIIVKVTDHNHGGRALEQSDWIKAAVLAPLYFKLATVRSTAVTDGRWKASRVPRSNGAVYLIFRHDGRPHVDFDELYRRQDISRLRQPDLLVRTCRRCEKPLSARARSDARTCSDRCRHWVYDERRRAEASR